MLVVLCLVIGTIIGELIGIEKGFEHFGEWLKKKTGNSGDTYFVTAFVTASLTVSIGAMAIVGAIQDGLTNDYSTLAVNCDFSSICTLGILKIIRGFEVTSKGCYQGETTCMIQ